MWRDIPAQVNAQVGPRAAPGAAARPFQRAIDRAKRKAKIRTAQEDVAQWRRVSRPLDGDGPAAAQAEADRLEAEYSQERLGKLAFAGGWERDVDEPREDDRVTDTVVSSATREVVIGFGRPFVMIGERINPTGRKLLAEEMRNGDFSRVEADAVAQVAGRRPHARRQRRHPARRRAGAARQGRAARPVGHRRAAVDRLLDRRGPRGRPRGLPGQAPRQLGHRRGRGDGAGAPARRPARRRGGGDLQRRDRDQRRTSTSASPSPSASSSGPPTTASPPPTSSSTRS